MSRKIKIPKVDVSDLVGRAKTLSEKVRPPRRPERDPDAYVRVVERPGPVPAPRRPLFRDDLPGDDE